MKKIVKIANGQGFWGDSVQAPVDLINYGKIDYLTLDYLAEITISIMQKQKMKNPKYGYALDFVDLIQNNYSTLIKNKIKVISNAGGVNPVACAKHIKENLPNGSINIGIIEGDDIYNDIDKLIVNGADLSKIFVILPNGQAMLLKRKLFQGDISSRILPGSTIVVSRNPDPFNWLNLTSIITPVLSDLAVSAAAIAAISNNN